MDFCSLVGAQAAGTSRRRRSPMRTPTVRLVGGNVFGPGPVPRVPAPPRAERRVPVLLRRRAGTRRCSRRSTELRTATSRWAEARSRGCRARPASGPVGSAPRAAACTAGKRLPATRVRAAEPGSRPGRISPRRSASVSSSATRPTMRLRVALVDHRGEAGRLGEDLEQGGVVELGRGLGGLHQCGEGALDHRPRAQPAVAQAGLRRGADVDAEVAGGELDQHVALAREVAEEGGPADVGVGDHVLDPGRGDAVGRVVGDRRGVDPIALVDPAGLGGRRREALARSLGAGLAVADQTPLADVDPRFHIEYRNL